MGLCAALVSFRVMRDELDEIHAAHSIHRFEKAEDRLRRVRETIAATLDDPIHIGSPVLDLLKRL